MRSKKRATTLSVLMVTVSEMATDARVCREAETLADEGYTVKILCLASSMSPEIRHVELVEYRYGWLPRRIRLVAMSVGFFVSTVIRSADIYHAHNVPALPGCWVAARVRRAILVYDGHEVYSLDDVFLHGGNRLHTTKQKFEAKIERILGRRADLRLTAGDKYGQVMARALNVDPPITIPNYPPLPDSILESPLRAMIKCQPDDVIVLYQGGFFLGSRDLATLVKGMKLLPGNYHLVLLGFGIKDESEQLALLARNEGVQDRVHVLPPVRHQELARYTSGADIGVIPLRLKDDGDRLCAPNKLYEYFQGSVAVLSARASEVVEVLAATDAGRTYQFDSPVDFATQVQSFGATREKIALFGQRGRIAAENQYSWEAVKHVLVDAYTTLDATITP